MPGNCSTEPYSSPELLVLTEALASRPLRRFQMPSTYISIQVKQSQQGKYGGQGLMGAWGESAKMKERL